MVDSKKTIVFLIFQEIHPDEGISKKILAQKKGFEEQGYECLLGRIVATEDGSANYFIGDKQVQSYGKGLLKKIKIVYKFSGITKYLTSIAEQVSFVYIRYNQFANFSSKKLFWRLYRSGIKTVVEIPTFPYDGEFHFTSIKSYRIIEERLTRKLNFAHIDYIATFSNNEEIFGVPTIRIDNSIDSSTIAVKTPKNNPNEFNIIGVAGLSFWHGYDRVILGLKNYFQNNPLKSIKFHIVGGYPGAKEYERLKKIVKSNSLEGKVIFYGTMSGQSLDDLFDYADVAIGCLGCHRKGIVEVQSLKNVEYAARGIPFVYSEINKKFDRQNYVLKVSPDETPINIDELISFVSSVKSTPEEIRSTITKYSWTSQMKKVISFMQ